MRKGGYKILDFRKTPLVNGTKVVIKGIYDRIESCNKVFLLSGLLIDNSELSDLFATYSLANAIFTFDIGNYTLAIDASDNVLATKRGA